MKLRKFLSLPISALLVASVVTAIEVQPASAEVCPINELSPLFFEEYFPGIKWDNSSGNRVITWTTNVTKVNSKDITRPFTGEEETWLDLSFGSWDLALDTISFKRVADPVAAEIRVGYVAINNDGYWTVELENNFRVSATIEISSVPEFTKFKDGFIEATQSEIGNVLGLGDMRESSPLDSVLKDPDTFPYGSLPLSDIDIDLMRQFYGESTCHEAWSPALKAAKAQALEIVTKAATEAKAIADKAAADAAAKVLAEKLAADKLVAETAAKALADKAIADAKAAAAAKAKKKTITCVKGKLIKKVTAVKPVCPKGYKLKK
jgi:hypothetical protein